MSTCIYTSTQKQVPLQLGILRFHFERFEINIGRIIKTFILGYHWDFINQST